MKPIAFFHESGSGLVSLVGGKASNLVALTAAGFPVPPGFVVTAEAYERFLDSIPSLDEELQKFAYDQPDLLRGQCARLRDGVGQAELPALLREAIHAALAQLGEDAAFAVRSSSTFEDLAQAAFAGQHDTYLNVRGPEAVVRRVRDCFASLWGDRAVLYRHRQGFDQRAARMAVVVQRQVACDVAGVGFSMNPVAGRLDQLVIDANYGLGESVVAGDCEVDHFELDKKSLQVTGRTIGHKTTLVAPTADGVEERPVAPELTDRPCLTDEQLQAIGTLLKRVEAHYGWPQDIEWGWQAGRLYILQSRPVTTFEPRWTRDESAERFPLPITPLTWDFIRVAFERAVPHSLELMGLPAFGGAWFACFGHYVYGNQTAVELIASQRPLRARTPQELVAEIPELRRRYAWVLELPVVWARDLDRYLVRLGRLSAVNLDPLDLPELGRHLAECLDVATEYFRPNIAITTTGAFLHRLLHGLAGMVTGPERSLAVLDGLLAGCETKTAVVNRELHELARLAARVPALRQRLLELGGRRFWERGELERFPEFAARFGRFLEDHGHREMDMDHYHPTWSGQPWVVLDALTLILRDGHAEDPAEVARRLREKYAATEHDFLAQVPQELRFFFRELIRLARTYTALDDLEHYQTTRINPLARRAALAIGRRLQAHGVLDAPEDVFFFTKDDLEELLKGQPRGQREAYRQKVYQVKRSYEAAKSQAPPWSLADAPAAPTAAGSLRGLPGSPGRATGACFRVQSPDDFARFPKGAILVARTTNPAWTPLFYSAAGLITESGGPLSHGAVTAREMRLPAVMSVRGAMTQFADGQVVTVDGTRGVVIPTENG